MRGTRSFWKYVLFCALVLANGSSSAALVVDTNWWSNRTSSFNVIDPLFGTPPITERVRLSNFTSGFIEGAVPLSHTGEWIVKFNIAADTDIRRDPNDFVDVFINGGLIERVVNNPAGSRTEILETVFGSEFEYRFEFSSSNADTGLHQIVERGTAALVPLPGALFLFASGIIAFGILSKLKPIDN